MKTEFKPFNETTLDDAKSVVGAAFSPVVYQLLEKILANPLRRELGNGSAGDIAYQNGKPVAFQAAIVRRLYIGKNPIIGVVGSTLGALPETSPVMLMQLMKRTIASRDGSVLFFANTANATSMKMNRLLGVKGMGPRTCEQIRFASIVSFPVLRNLCPRSSAVKLDKIDKEQFDIFWTKYLNDNKGVVASRSSAELEWMFGDNVAKGTDVILATYEGSEISGYIVVRKSRKGRGWLVVDMLALDNDRATLRLLLVSAVRYLRREARSLILESIGFPLYVEDLTRSILPLYRKTLNNTFLFKAIDPGFTVPESSWFFGPYDGDRSM